MPPITRRTNIPGLIMGGRNKSASLTTALTGTNNDLTFTSDAKADTGNSVRITYTNPNVASAALAVTVSGSDITVSLGNTATAGTISSTAAQVRDAVNGHAAASALVDAANAPGNDGTGVVTAMPLTALTGGTSRFVGRPFRSR